MPHLLVDSMGCVRARSAERLRAATRGRPGFSLVDLLVSIAVIAVLLAILLPTLTQVWEMARRVECASNVKQMGYGIAMYAEDYDDWLPPSIYLANGAVGTERPEKMNTLRVSPAEGGNDPMKHWDGIGILFSMDYLPAPKLFYCPSHTGNNPFTRYASYWQRDKGAIRGNYQYRGQGPDGVKLLSVIKPDESSLLTDGMATQEDFNHRVGANVLRADLNVFWFDDPAGTILSLLPPASGGGGGDGIRDAWDSIDDAFADDGPG